MRTITNILNSFLLFIKTLFTGRVVYLTLTFAILIVISYYLHIHQHPFLVNIVAGVGVSFLTTALIIAFEKIRGDKVNRFISLFSINPRKKIAIVLPKFRSGVVLLDPTKPDDAIDLSKRPSVSKTDSFTAYKFAGLVQKYGLPLPDLLSDDEAIALLEDPKALARYSTFISIGLYSNTFSKTIQENFFTTGAINFIDNKRTDKAGNKVIGWTDGGIQELTPNKHSCSDLALLAKVSINQKKLPDFSVVICGGLNATGTRAIGDFVYQNWYEAIATLKISKEPITQIPNFALLYDVMGELDSYLDENASITNQDPVKRKAFNLTL